MNFKKLDETCSVTKKLAEYIVPKHSILELQQIEFSISIPIQRFIVFEVVVANRSITDKYFRAKSDVDTIELKYNIEGVKKIEFYMGSTKLCDDISGTYAAGNINIYACLEGVLKG